MATFNQLMGQLQAGRLNPAFTLNPIDGGGGDGFGGGFPIFGPGPIDPGGPGGGGPGYGVTLPGGGGTTTTTTPTATSASWVQSLLNYFTGSGCGVGDFLLRIAFFILGFVCVIGAIYLYKGSNTILQIPGHIVRGTVKAGRTAIEEGAEA